MVATLSANHELHSDARSHHCCGSAKQEKNARIYHSRIKLIDEMRSKAALGLKRPAHRLEQKTFPRNLAVPNGKIHPDLRTAPLGDIEEGMLLLESRHRFRLAPQDRS